MADYSEQLFDTPRSGAGEGAYKRAGGVPKKDLLRKYRQCIETSRKWRKDEKFEDTWRDLVDLYRNKHFADGLKEADRIAVNVSFSTVNVIVPSIAVNYPTITVNPRDELLMPQAEAAEAAVNYWWRLYDWRKEVKRAVKDSLIIGHGWVKVGWRYRSTMRPLTPEEQAQQLMEMAEQADLYAEANPDLAQDLPTDDEIAEQLPTETSMVVEDRPFVERVSPFDMLIDPEATCPQDLKWIAQRLVLPLDEVKGDKRYNARARNKLQPDSTMGPRWRDDEEGKQKYSDDVKRVTLWEFYELRKGDYCVFADAGGDDFLLDPTDFPYPFGHPFVPVLNYEVPDQFYSIGDLEALEPLQAELNAVRSDMRNHRKRWQRAYVANRNALDDEAQHVLESDEDGRIVYVDEDLELDRVIRPIEQIPLDPQMYQYSDQIESDIELISGISEYQRGALSEIRRTATEASIIQDAANARAADKLANIEDFMREIAERVVQLAQTFLTGEHIARIVGPDGAAVWVPFDRERIKGQFDFEVEAGSTQPRNEMFRRQQALQMANMLAPFLSLGVVDPFALVTHLLKEGFGIKNPEQFLADPLMMQMMAGGMGAPAGGAPPSEQGDGSPEEGTTLPEEGASAVPPNLLAQLQGQVGLDVSNL